MSEQEQHIEQLRQERSCYICGARPMQPARVAALDAGIAALKREQEMGEPPQPTLDLEPVRRMILAATPPGHVQRSRDEAIEWDRMVAEYAEEAIPALRSLLAENERLREWKAEAMEVLSQWEDTWIAAGKPGELGRSKALAVTAEIERLRGENAKLLGLLKELHALVEGECPSLLEEDSGGCARLALAIEIAIMKAPVEGLSQ